MGMGNGEWEFPAGTVEMCVSGLLSARGFIGDASFERGQRLERTPTGTYGRRWREVLVQRCSSVVFGMLLLFCGCVAEAW